MTNEEPGSAEAHLEGKRGRLHSVAIPAASSGRQCSPALVNDRNGLIVLGVATFRICAAPPFTSARENPVGATESAPLTSCPSSQVGLWHGPVVEAAFGVEIIGTPGCAWR